MKNILLFILLLGTGLLCAQTQEKSVSVMIFDVVPTHTPCQYCSELALVRADNLIYQYQDPPGAWLPYLPADVPDYVTDSTRLVEGNILVSWRDGVEVQRDTLELSGMVDAVDVLLEDTEDNFITNNAEFAFLDLFSRVISISNALGISDFSTNFGTFTGTLFPDNQTAKQLLQLTEVELERLADSLAAHRVDIDASGGGSGVVVADGATITGDGSVGDPLTVGTISGGNIGTGEVGPTQLASSGVTAGTYTNATVTLNEDGIATAASSGAAGITGAVTENYIPVADATGDLENSAIIDDGNIVEIQSRSLRLDGISAYNNVQYGGPAIVTNSSTGALVINTGITLPWVGARYVTIELSTYKYFNNAANGKPGKWVISFLATSSTANPNVYSIGKWFGTDRVRFMKDTNDVFCIVIGEETDNTGQHVWVEKVTWHAGDPIDASTWTMAYDADISDLSLVTAATAADIKNTNISTVAPANIGYRANNDVYNSVLKLYNPLGSLTERVGLEFYPGLTPDNLTTTQRGFGIEAWRRKGLLFNTKCNSSTNNYVGAFAFSMDEDGQFGISVEDPQYSFHDGSSSAAWLLNPHDVTLIGTEGLFIADDSKNKFAYHDGIQLQYPLWESEIGTSVGTMSSWTLAADTGTPASITNATTATIAGSAQGIDVAMAGSTATVSLDLSEIPVQTTLGGNEYFAIYDVINGNQLTHIDSLKSYLFTAGVGGIYSGSGTIPDNTTAQTAAGAGFVVDDGGYMQLTGAEILVNTDIFATNAATISLTDRFGEGVEKMTLVDGILSYSPDDRALIATQTSGRAVMFDGSNSVSEFPLESTGGITRQTQVTAFELARGTTGERPSATTSGRIRQNTTTGKTEISNGSGWDNAATEDYVDDAITETNFTQNTDVAIFPDKKIEHFTLESTSGAVSNTTLSLPTAGAAYEGYMVKVWSIDTSGSFDNSVTASTIQNGATTGSTITLGNFQATEISCIRVGAASYRWVVTNQY